MKFARNTSLFLFALTILAFVFLTTCGKDSPTKPQNPGSAEPPPQAAPAAARIDITPSFITFSAIGETAQLTARVFDQNSTAMSGAVVTWKSSGTAVATVSTQGLVTAVGNGNATIMAQSGSVSELAAVTVMQTTGSITVEPESAMLMSLGETVQFIASVLDGNGQPVADAHVSWQSSDSTVATVSTQGLVTAVGNGNATIMAQSGSVSEMAAVTVMQTTGSITVEPESAMLMSLGETVQFIASVLDGNGQPVADAHVSWQSSDSTVATVSTQGLVTAVGNGNATIMAQSGSVSELAAVTVMQTAGSIMVEPESVTLTSLGETAQFTASVLDGNGQPVADAHVSWQSSDSTVALVSTQGLVTAAGNGSAQISARSGAVSATVEVAVMQTPISIRMEPSLAVLTDFGETIQINAIVTDQNFHPMTGVTIDWTSINPEVATVTGTGLVTAHANGTATITARSGDLSGNADISVEGPGSARAILTAFYIALDGTSWINGTNWLTVAPVPNWHGVSVDALGRVTTLNLSKNGMTGSIPQEISQLSALEGLALDGNRLTGRIPSELGNLSNLKHLYLSSNLLTGAIPSELGRLENLLHLCLDRNRLTGTVPEELGSLTNLKWLHLFENFNLSGPLPGALTELDLSELLLQNTRTCAPLTERFTRWLGGIEDRQVAACGEQPEQNADRAALVAFYNATGGSGWENNTNWLSDRSLSSWHGVDTDKNGRMTGLYFNENNLSGSIPPELGQLANLMWISISKENLSGEIPTELSLLKNLVRLFLDRNNISGSVPDELGQLENLKVLDLSGNRLTGEIPPELGQLQNLENLNLGSDPLTNLRDKGHGNSLSGEIPPELGQLQNLKMLTLSSNQLTGKIPPELGQLHNLQDLSLSRNQLMGEIPAELGQLTKLSSLWLLMNNLSGSLPPEIGDLVNLEILQLSDNQDLTGPLPANLTNLSKLRYLNILGTKLCIPSDEAFNDWVGNIGSTEIVRCKGESSEDRNALAALYHAVGGSSWSNNTNWLSDAPIDQWHGVATGNLGRVESLDLASNNLVGRLTGALGSLIDLRHLRLDGNPGLSGPLPVDLSNLNIESLTLGGTAVCIPDNEGFLAWFRQVSDAPVSPCTLPSSDREALIAFYHATGGDNWTNNTNWMSDLPLDQWFGVSVTDATDKVVRLSLNRNNLTGEIPSELAQLKFLRYLDLNYNQLTGSIPAELGQLNNLEVLTLSGTELTGSIPPELSQLQNLRALSLRGNLLIGSIPAELGQLRNLQRLNLTGNNLTGTIPAELGHLKNLRTLDLNGTRFRGGNGLLRTLKLTGEIPSELGQLQNLQRLDLSGLEATGTIPPELGQLKNLNELNLGGQLTGEIPPELGQLKNLKLLSLHSNQLTGEIPSELGQLKNLELLSLSGDQLTGEIPLVLVQLQNLELFSVDGRGLCAPRNTEFRAWLSGIEHVYSPGPCPLNVDLSKSAAYLTQSVQSFFRPVPLVGDEPALLRVFLASDGAVSNKPEVKATFYNNGAEVHSAVIPSGGVRIPDQVDESTLSISSNALVPADIIRPGLSFSIELGNEEGRFTGSMGRIPVTGTIEVDVRELPVFDLTMVPLLWSENPDFSVVAETDELTEESHLFRLTRDLLPVQEFQLTIRDPIYVSVDPVFGSGVSAEVAAVRIMDGASGYYLGVLRGSGGTAWPSHPVSVSGLDGDTIVHELGHNLSLGHAPCDKSFGAIGSLDTAFPYDDGNIGAWGFDFDSNVLVYPATPDLMSYCEPVWISDYNFNKMMEYRLTREADRLLTASSPVSRSLLLWGGESEGRGLYLEPSFAVDAPISLPDGGGPYRIEGRDASGNSLFELDFAMGEIADGEGGVFVFAIPVTQEWSSQLARVTLTGPEGYAQITRDGGRSAALLLDQSTGRVRGILRDWPAPDGSAISARRVLPISDLDVVISRGIPDVGDW